MQITEATISPQTVVFDYIKQDLPGGVSLDTDRFATGVTGIKAGTPVYVDKTNRIAYLVKTSTVITSSTATAVRVAKNGHWIVGEYVSDGYVAQAISSITTTGSTYDVLNLGGSLSVYAAGTIIFETTAGNLYKGSHAQVEDTAGDYLDIYDPTFTSEGLKITIAQTSGNTLSVTYSNHVLAITLANSTAATNNAAAIQAAINALVEEDYPWAAFYCVGTDWDGKQTGATLTTAADTFEAVYPDKYVPNGFIKDYVDVTYDNADCSVVLAGAVRNSALPFPLTTAQKALLPNFIFNY
ncbi:MAG: hypothetical protein M0Q91_11945 [Methanoregula sp.]|jgi:hypothetical protein|nr:hypothetical protein [Methanoregula sp.]